MYKIILVIKTVPLLLVLFLITGCNYFREASYKPNTTAFDLAQVKNDMIPLDLKKPYKPTKEISSYFKFYDLDKTNAVHYFGIEKSENNTLALHVFVPPSPQGTIFLIHGYFDHTGTLSKLITAGLEHNYAIVSWDLPGHGLSSGIRTETGELKSCAKQFSDIIEKTENKLPHPLYLIAHSTGCSVSLEYLYNSSTNIFDQIIFLAPLIRHAQWKRAKFGYTIAKPFTQTIRRRRKENSSDKSYLAFVKADPLHSSTLSFGYLKYLYKWEKDIKKRAVWPGSIFIIQGDADKVVDRKYNLKFLRSKIKNTDIKIIPGARHQLANEREELRKKSFDLIFNKIKNPK